MSSLNVCPRRKMLTLSCTCEVTVILCDPRLVPGQDSIKNSNWKGSKEGHKVDSQTMCRRDVIQRQTLNFKTFSSDIWPQTQRSCFLLQISEWFYCSLCFWFCFFVSHSRTRLSNSYNLKTPVCKTSTFQASYFNRIAKLWNYICKFSHPTSFSTTASFRNFVTEHMIHLLHNHFDIHYSCTWSIVRSCPCHP